MHAKVTTEIIEPYKVEKSEPQGLIQDYYEGLATAGWSG